METQEHRVSRTYSSVFIVDSAKLSRLANVIEERIKSISPTPFRHFEIRTYKDKVFSARALERIFEHDNAVKNPIVNLKMTFSDKDEEPTNSCTVFFDVSDPEIEVKIKGENPKWANDLFSEVDEQIERSFVANWVYSVKRQKSHEWMSILMALVMLPLMLFSFFVGGGSKKVETTNFLTPADVEVLQQFAVGATQQEDKVNFTYQLLTRQLNNSHKPEQVGTVEQLTRLSDHLTFKSALLVLPAVVALCSLFYLLKYCYPGSSFLWGDMLEHYNTLVERRKVVWNAILIALLVGILGNLFVFGLSRFM